MGAPVIRKGVDNSRGHCYEPRPANTGSPNVYVNGIPVVRVGDHYPTHSCGNSSHDGDASQGAPNVYVNGKAIHRAGDSISCGDTASGGSPNVFVGDGGADTIQVSERRSRRSGGDLIIQTGRHVG
jgi:uncharacterized Zn-binding protein involved in type VI secretion